MFIFLLLCCKLLPSHMYSLQIYIPRRQCASIRLSYVLSYAQSRLTCSEWRLSLRRTMLATCFNRPGMSIFTISESPSVPPSPFPFFDQLELWRSSTYSFMTVCSLSSSEPLFTNSLLKPTMPAQSSWSFTKHKMAESHLKPVILALDQYGVHLATA